MAIKLTVTISEGDKDALDHLCKTHGYLRGGRPNISEMIRSIASGGILLTPNPDNLEEDLEHGEF